MIRYNRHKYSISAMCTLLQVPRPTYYYVETKRDNQDKAITEVIIKFFSFQSSYIRWSKKEQLKKLGYIVSRRHIGLIMKKQGLVSNYTKAQFKPQKSKVNENVTTNTLNREELEVVVSDLAYVRVGQKWHSICVLIDQIIDHNSGPNKNSVLVTRASRSVRTNLHWLKLFHTDRGSEFKNKSIDEALDTFGIERSLSEKGIPYDNAVAEAAFKTLKT